MKAIVLSLAHRLNAKAVGFVLLSIWMNATIGVFTNGSHKPLRKCSICRKDNF